MEDELSAPRTTSCAESSTETTPSCRVLPADKMLKAAFITALVCLAYGEYSKNTLWQHKNTQFYIIWVSYVMARRC